ncbi:MAG: hypothetical protein IJH65_15295 [Methanobrevibacter sp.]|nr:hypothetical protein [Methanobrevibacter sp.]
MPEHHITSEDVMNYYSSIFGGRRQFEGMRIDSGNSERYIVIDPQYDFMSDCDYYKMTLKNMIEIHRPDLLNREHKFTPVQKLIIDEWENEVEQPNQLPVMKLSDLPGKIFDSKWAEYVKDWLSPNRIM